MNRGRVVSVWRNKTAWHAVGTERSLCGLPVVDDGRRFDPQDEACRTCARLAAIPERRAGLIEDVEELMAFGESPHAIARRLDATLGALAREMYRAGRNDLGNLFNRPARKEYRAS